MVKIIVLSIIVLFCLILSGYFSCLDMAYSSANRHYLERESKNKKRAKIALKYCLEYDKTITTVIFSNNLVNIASSSASAILGIILFKDIFNLVNMDEFLINTITSATLTILIIGFGEVLPKAIGRLYAEKVAIGSVYFVKFIQILFFPFVFVTTKLAEFITKPILKKKHKYDDEEITNEELTEMVDQIEESGQIDEEHGDLIRSAIILKETEAHEIMTPRVDVFFFDVDDEKCVEEAVERIRVMETYLTKATELLNKRKLTRSEKKSLLTYRSKLDDYYTSEAWKFDLKLDELGKLPDDLKRGVLSEDGIADILDRFD